MNITLNIGINVSQNYLPDGVAEMKLKYTHVKDLLEEDFGKPLCIRMAQSATEDTIVVQYTDVEYVLYRLHSLAQDLQQDCIAYTMQDDDGTVLGGALVGTYAHACNYGIFDEVLFIPADIKLNDRVGLPL